jgi:hypothetical protein
VRHLIVEGLGAFLAFVRLFLQRDRGALKLVDLI